VAAAIPILMYHHIAATAPRGFEKYTVTPTALGRQLGWLAWRGYESIGLDALSAARGRPDVLPNRPIVVTFDDGFRDGVAAAIPALVEHRMRATFFIVADRIGGTSDWLERERGVTLPLVDRDRIREIADLGFDIGSHSMTHPHLPALPRAAIGSELAGSRRRLEDIVGRAVRHLAYPHGEDGHTVREVTAESGYLTATTTEQGFAGSSTDLLALPRLIVDGRDTIGGFVARLRAAEGARQLARRGPLEAVRRLRAGPDGSVR
jgi:peptidoglycan/xylan/chitin deacetylase (PgdA/CDA1 family)